jgi:predicted GNAT family acetyltransferase
MAIEVQDDRAQDRYEATVDATLAGFAAYRLRPSLIAFTHTEIDDGFAGHGVGSTLIQWALDDARRRSLEVLPFCPFVNAYIDQHRDYVDLVPVSHRAAFGL